MTEAKSAEELSFKPWVDLQALIEPSKAEITFEKKVEFHAREKDSVKKREKTRNPHAEMKSAKTKPPDQAFQDPLRPVIGHTVMASNLVWARGMLIL